ncbi:hypothetical protein ACU686_38360 [Yinghuangia aomiensis]
MINDIEAEYAEAAAKDITEAGGQAIVVVGDIREPETVVRLRDAALGAAGGGSTCWSTTWATTGRRRSSCAARKRTGRRPTRSTSSTCCA